MTALGEALDRVDQTIRVLRTADAVAIAYETKRAAVASAREHCRAALGAKAPWLAGVARVVSHGGDDRVNVAVLAMAGVDAAITREPRRMAYAASVVGTVYGVTKALNRVLPCCAWSSGSATAAASSRITAEITPVPKLAMAALALAVSASEVYTEIATVREAATGFSYGWGVASALSVIAGVEKRRTEPADPSEARAD